MIEKSIFGWSRLPSVTSRQINDLSLLDMSRGWAVCDSGVMLKYMNPAIDIQLSGKTFRAGDTFLGIDRLLNPGPAVEVQIFIFIEIYYYYYFYPSFSSSVEFETAMLPENSFEDHIFLPEFVWPSGVGTGSGATVWGALVADGKVLNYDTESFGWE
jgi:hypothetical protein